MAHRTPRVVMIGCGGFGRYHCHAWRELGADIVGICDTDPLRLEERAGAFGIDRRSTDAASLLDDLRPDVVDVVTRVESHGAMLTLCGERALPAICQKPFMPTLAEAVAIARLPGRPMTTVHENFRFQRTMRLVAQLLRRGDLGEPVFGRISFRSGYDIYPAQPYLALGERFIIMDLGVHLLDLARCFLGEVASLSCITRKVNPAIRGEDVATILLRHRNGAACAIDMSYAGHVTEELFPQTLVDIECLHGSIRVHRDYQVTVVHGSRRESFDARPEPRAWYDPPGMVVQESVVTLQRHWIDCWLQGMVPENSAVDHLHTMALVDAAYASAASGVEITPEPS